MVNPGHGSVKTRGQKLFEGYQHGYSAGTGTDGAPSEDAASAGADDVSSQDTASAETDDVSSQEDAASVEAEDVESDADLVADGQSPSTA